MAVSKTLGFSAPFLLVRPKPCVFPLLPLSPRRRPARPKFFSAQNSVTADEVDDDDREDCVEELLSGGSPAVEQLMKMERGSAPEFSSGKWFPYVNAFRACGGVLVSAAEVVAALDPYIQETRKDRMRRAVSGRSYGLCLVVEGLSDFGNVSAAFRSADALGIQSVHVVSCDGSKRFRGNRHISMGAEKWLDIELWNSPTECFHTLRSRGYRIAAACLGTDSISVYKMDWSVPTAIVVGNERMGVSNEVLSMSDLCCSIPMNGMVGSFNVSVAAGILMHHAVCDRVSRLGFHGDLTPEQRNILLAEFFLRHRESAASIVDAYTKRKAEALVSKL